MRLCWPGPAAPRLTSGSPWGVVWPERWTCRPGPQSQTHRPGRGPRTSQGLVLTPNPANTSITQGPGPGAAPLLQTHLRRHRQTEPRAGMREHHPASLALLGWGQGFPAAHGASSRVTAKLPTLPPALSPGTSPPHPPQRWGADTAGRRFLPPRGPPSPFSAQWSRSTHLTLSLLHCISSYQKGQNPSEEYQSLVPSRSLPLYPW